MSLGLILVAIVMNDVDAEVANQYIIKCDQGDRQLTHFGARQEHFVLRSKFWSWNSDGAWLH